VPYQASPCVSAPTSRGVLCLQRYLEARRGKIGLVRLLKAADTVRIGLLQQLESECAPDNVDGNGADGTQPSMSEETLQRLELDVLRRQCARLKSRVGGDNEGNDGQRLTDAERQRLTQDVEWVKRQARLTKASVLAGWPPCATWMRCEAHQVESSTPTGLLWTVKAQGRGKVQSADGDMGTQLVLGRGEMAAGVEEVAWRVHSQLMETMQHTGTTGGDGVDIAGRTGGVKRRAASISERQAKKKQRKPRSASMVCSQFVEPHTSLFRVMTAGCIVWPQTTCAVCRSRNSEKHIIVCSNCSMRVHAVSFLLTTLVCCFVAFCHA